MYMSIQKKVSTKLKCIVSKSFLDFLWVHMVIWNMIWSCSWESLFVFVNTVLRDFTNMHQVTEVLIVVQGIPNNKFIWNKIEWVVQVLHNQGLPDYKVVCMYLVFQIPHSQECIPSSEEFFFSGGRQPSHSWGCTWWSSSAAWSWSCLCRWCPPQWEHFYQTSCPDCPDLKNINTK